MPAMSFVKYTAENKSGALMAMKRSLVKVTSPMRSPKRMVKFQCDVSRHQCKCRYYGQIKLRMKYVVLCAYNAFNNKEADMKIDFKHGDEMAEVRYCGTVHYIPVRYVLAALFLAEDGEKEFVKCKTGARMFDVSEKTFKRLAVEAGATYKDEKDGKNGTVFIDPALVSKYIRSMPSA